MRKIIILLVMITGLLFGADIKWAKDYQTGLATAKKEHKPMLFIISRDSCKYCILLDNTTLKDPKVIEELNKHFIAVRAWTNENDYIPYLLRQNTPGLPGIWFLDTNGDPLFQPLLGYLKKENFYQALKIVEKAFSKQKNESKK
jgi:thioredoxin-related protein